MPHPLVNTAGTNNIYSTSSPFFQVLLCQTTAYFHQKVLSLRPLLYSQEGRAHFFNLEIVQHDNIRAGFNGLERLTGRLAFDFNLGRKATNRACCQDCAWNRARGPNVVVFEHGHGAEVVAMRVAAAYQHPIFFHKSETWCCLARTGKRALVASWTQEV